MSLNNAGLMARYLDGRIINGSGLQYKQKSALIIDHLGYYSSVELLVELGPQRLKEDLSALGLKCDGSVLQRVERLFLLKHTALDQLHQKHFAKGSRSIIVRKNGHADQLKNSFRNNTTFEKDIAFLEVKMHRLCELLSEVIIQTKENAERKPTLTYQEMEAEWEEEMQPDSTETDAEEQQIHNPLKLPMGWDGKPSYSILELYGLGQEFKYEICGNP